MTLSIFATPDPFNARVRIWVGAGFSLSRCEKTAPAAGGSEAL